MEGISHQQQASFAPDRRCVRPGQQPGRGTALTSEPLDLSSLLYDAAVLGKSLAREKNLEWRQQIPDHLPLVWGDRTRLRQVTINLLSNAVKFTEHGYVSLAVSSDDNRRAD